MYRTKPWVNASRCVPRRRALLRSFRCAISKADDRSYTTSRTVRRRECVSGDSTRLLRSSPGDLSVIGKPENWWRSFGFYVPQRETNIEVFNFHTLAKFIFSHYSNVFSFISLKNLFYNDDDICLSLTASNTDLLL